MEVLLPMRPPTSFAVPVTFPVEKELEMVVPEPL
jgi:hypothetical protein